MWYQESLSLLERRADGRSEGRHGSPRVFPHTFNDKYIYFPNLEWKIVVAQLKQLEKNFVLSGKPHIIVGVNMFVLLQE